MKELDSLIHALELHQKEDTVKLSLYNSIVIRAIKNDNEMAYRYAKKGYELGKNLYPVRLVAISSYQYAKVLQTKGEHLKATQIIEHQISVFTSEKEISPPFLYHQLGKIYDETGNKVEALNNYLRAFESWRSYKHPLLTKEDFYESIANLYLESQQYREAQYYYEELSKWAIKESTNLDEDIYENKKVQATASQGLARIFIAKKEYDTALFYLQKSEEFCIGKSKRKCLLDTYNLYSKLFFIKFDYNLAKKYAFEALQIAEQLGEQQQIILLSIRLGDIYSAETSYDKAELFLKRAEKTALSLDNNLLYKQVYFSFANLYEKKQKDKMALSYYRKYLMYKDSVNNEVSIRKINSLQMQFEQERHRQEIDVLQLNQREKQLQQKAEVDRAQAFNIIGLIAVIALGIVAFLIYNRYRFGERTQKILQRQSHSINKQNQKLQNINEQLLESKKELNAINRTKDRFFSIVAHDLKGPLNSLKGYSHLISTFGDKLPKEEIISMATDQERTLDNLYKFLEDLLSWSRIQMKAVALEPKNIELKSIVDKMCEILMPQIEEKGIDAQCIDVEGKYVFADENAVFTILRNLVSNAVKFTPREGIIRVKAEKEKDKDENETGFIKISVIDTGIGMPKVVYKRLFRLDNKHSTKGTEGEKGTGLGLIICKEFVEQNGGKIGVKSKEGEGTTFWFTLPSKNDDYNSDSNKDKEVSTIKITGSSVDA
ncbi:tetratricopeptide repeat-containing sensor histidine kinase [Bernardetia litoralis]|uniref:tetratricopeptide repeat-containing sensor histidine kinase n=1 Tax=Bernardetia litoralis TaxID=999 RepID=UPI0002DACF73|nr:tetratricopeptide repeat-containing sensor histidine kinase [Bernardetia litoralis]